MSSRTLTFLIALLLAATAYAGGPHPEGSDAPDWLTGIDVSAGRVPGYIAVNKFGTNIDIDSGATETVWECDGLLNGASLYRTPYDAVFGGGATTLYMSATTVGQTGTIIQIEGLDGDGNLVSDQKTTNGTNAVALDGTWTMVHRAYTVSGDIGLSSVLIHDDPTPIAGFPDPDPDESIVGCITLAENQTQMAVYKIPSGYTGYLTRLHYGASKTSSALFAGRLKILTPDGAYRTISDFGVTTDSNYVEDYLFPVRLESGTLLEVTAQSSTNNLVVHATFSLLLRKE